MLHVSEFLKKMRGLGADDEILANIIWDIVSAKNSLSSITNDGAKD